MTDDGCRTTVESSKYIKIIVCACKSEFRTKNLYIRWVSRNCLNLEVCFTDECLNSNYCVRMVNYTRSSDLSGNQWPVKADDFWYNPIDSVYKYFFVFSTFGYEVNDKNLYLIFYSLYLLVSFITYKFKLICSCCQKLLYLCLIICLQKDISQYQKFNFDFQVLNWTLLIFRQDQIIHKY